MKYRYMLFIVTTLLTIPPLVLPSCSSTHSASLVASAKLSHVSEWNALSQFSPKLLSFWGNAGLPGFDGAMSYNRKGFLQVGFQRHASDLIPEAVETQNLQKLASAIQTMEYAFNYQNPDGSFELNQRNSVIDTGVKPTPSAEAQATAFFFYDLGHSLLLLRESQWFQESNETSELRVRVNELTRKAETSLTWLMKQEALLRRDNMATNRVFVYGLAYYLVGEAVMRYDAMKLGKTFVQEALQQQTPDGVFLERSGFDSSYQAISLKLALWLYMHLKPSETVLQQQLWLAIERGINRELLSIQPTGEVSTKGNSRVYPGGEEFLGVEKGVDYLQVILALNYYAYLSGKPFVKQTAEQVLVFYQESKQRTKR